jgi:hypothetical protein
VFQVRTHFLQSPNRSMCICFPHVQINRGKC